MHAIYMLFTSQCSACVNVTILATPLHGLQSARHLNMQADCWLRLPYLTPLFMCAGSLQQQQQHAQQKEQQQQRDAQVQEDQKQQQPDPAPGASAQPMAKRPHVEAQAGACFASSLLTDALGSVSPQWNTWLWTEADGTLSWVFIYPGLLSQTRDTTLGRGRLFQTAEMLNKLWCQLRNGKRAE